MEIGDNPQQPGIELSQTQERVLVQIIEVYPEGITVQGLMSGLEKGRSATIDTVNQLSDKGLIVGQPHKKYAEYEGLGRPAQWYSINPDAVEAVVGFYEARAKRTMAILAKLRPDT